VQFTRLSPYFPLPAEHFGHVVANPIQRQTREFPTGSTLGCSDYGFVGSGLFENILAVPSHQSKRSDCDGRNGAGPR
jgi:hypothetical protein